MSSTAGFVPIRLDTLDLLGPHSGRRTGHLLAALGLSVTLADRADWRTDEVGPFRSVAFAGEQRMPWRRMRRVLDNLADVGMARATLHPFRPGRVRLTPRSDPASLLHDRDRPHERFVALSRGSLGAVADDHQLSWEATSLLVFFLLYCDYRTAELPDGWTKSRLCDAVGVGWRRLSTALEQLHHAGLITFEVRRGGPMTLTLLARPALVVPTATATGTVPPKRPERRLTQRQARHGSGPAADLAQRLLAHHQLPGPASAALVTALGDALATGTPALAVLERLAARGSLTDARDPIAILVARTRQLTGELRAARQAEEDRRRRQAEARQARAEQEADEQHRLEAVDLEHRWLAATLPELPSGAQLGLSPLIAARPLHVAARIHAACAELVASRPDLDPAELVRRWAQQPGPAAELDTSGVGPCTHADGPPGTLPRARAGPTLAARLRPTSA